MSATIDLIVTGLVVLVLAAAGLWVHHLGYIAGQNERTSHYEPLMKSSDDALLAANARANQIEENARNISTAQEAQDEQTQSALAARVNAADSRIADLLRQLSARPAAACGESVPAVAGPAADVATTAAGEQRNRELGASIATVGGWCEHDAEELAEFQHWYARQGANAVAPAAVK